jgi:NADH-quinone oxidoreductase subunit I
MSPRKHNPFVQYWINIWAGFWTALLGMKVTWDYLFDKTFTMRYPEEKPEIPETHRGFHRLEEGGCIACLQCQKVCPVDAISIEFVGRGKDAMLTRFDIDYSRCLYCSLCDDSCASKSLRMGPEFDKAGFSREEMVSHLARPKTKEEIDAHLKMLEEKEAERKAKLEAARKAKEAKEKKEEKEGT